MTAHGLTQIVLFSIVLVLVTKPIGTHLYAVMQGTKTLLDPVLTPVEKLSYKLCGVNPDEEMRASQYSISLLILSFVSLLFTYAVLRMQGILPLNPMGFSTAAAPTWATAMSPDLAFNTAVSFVTNTNWQAYSGENTMSYLSQMLALAFHNWLSAAVGCAAAFALIRGFARAEVDTLGNFWKDVIRVTLYVLLPICTVYALFLVSQGCVQNFNAYTVITTLEGASKLIPQGPVASQEAIKMLGINGGGIFNANSAHPFENPNSITDMIEMLSIFLLPAGLTYTFGKAVKNTRQGWAIFISMFVLFIAGTGLCYFFEAQGNPNVANQRVETSTAVLDECGGNMEGKELRFGLAQSALFATVTTDASCGAVNAMHDSFTPLGGLIPLLNIQLGEVVFGGVGSGLYGMLIFAVLAVFIAGLMVGRTPEYVGKKIEKKEVMMAMLFVLAGAFSILFFTGLSCALDLPVGSVINAAGKPINNIGNAGPHGFSEILYAFTSATGNNGSAFAGLSANTIYYNTTIALAMLIGRFMMMVPAIAVGGSLCRKKFVPVSSGTFPTDGAVFVVLLISVVIIVGALTFFPALTLGPVVEHFLMHSGKLF